jgi:hypothetical protein
MRILSLGAGVQSSVILLLMNKGEIEPADHAIFADTRAEPGKVYEWLAYLQKASKIPVHIVVEKEGLTRNIEDGCFGRVARDDGAPWFTLSRRGKIGQVCRKCTGAYKLAPIRRKANELRGKRKLVQVIGFSADEPERAKLVPHAKYVVGIEYPLLAMGWTRQQCIEWCLREIGVRPPRSACVYCPYRCDAEWRLLRDSDPEAWAEACRMDDLLRSNPPSVGKKQPCFVHRKCVPLRDVDLSTEWERGQLPLFADQCPEGMCGN